MQTALVTSAMRKRMLRSFVALVLLALFGSLQLLASSEILHQAIHPDAQSTNHHCAVTLLTHGQVNAPLVAGFSLLLVSSLLFSLPTLETSLQSALDLRLAPGRAPPRS